MHPALESLLDPALRKTHHGFETLRDQFGSLPVGALPDLLALAHDPASDDLRGAAVAALGDLQWPGAYASFLEWVVGDDPWMALDAGCALDGAGGGGFGYWDKVAPGDVPAPQRVKSVGPQLVAWWHAEGAARAPDPMVWQATQGRPPTPDERVYSYVSATRRAVLSNRFVVEDHRDLPRRAGKHITGGTCSLEAGEVRVAVVLDSDAAEPITAVMAESDHGWMDVRSRARTIRLDHVLGDTSMADFATARLEIGPTGSVRERR